MNLNIFNELNEGIRTAFIDSGSPSNLAYRPEFVTNDYKNGIKVLSHIDRELRNCEEFYMKDTYSE